MIATNVRYAKSTQKAMNMCQQANELNATKN